jgi:transposase
MQTYGSIIPGGPTLARILPKAASEARDPPLSRETKRRLGVLAWHEAHGKSVSLTARHFGLSRSTVYDWLKRHAKGGTRGLQKRSRKPHNLRQPTWSSELEQAVLKLRTEHPRWGKDKLVVLLRHQGLTVSVSMVGRILRRLKDAGRLLPADLRDSPAPA